MPRKWRGEPLFSFSSSRNVGPWVNVLCLIALLWCGSLACSLAHVGGRLGECADALPEALPADLLTVERDLHVAVSSRLKALPDRASKVASIRALTAAERSDLDNILLDDSPLALDQLVAIDVRFRRSVPGDGFGVAIIPKRYDGNLIDLSSGITSDYGRRLRSSTSHKEIAEDVRDFFRYNYEAAKPLLLDHVIPYHYFIAEARKRGVSADALSMRVNNTYAFAARKIRDTEKWSYHSVGAIDVNPFYNPAVMRTRKGVEEGTILDSVTCIDFEEGRILVDPMEARSYAVGRTAHRELHVLIETNSDITTFFRARGWFWGGDFRSLRDYQHFSPGPG